MPCPDENQILAFLDGRATGSEARRFEDHADACPECRALIAELGRAIEAAAPPLEHWPSRSGGDVVGPGDRIGRYLIVEPLGAGAMGVVFRAHDPDLDRDVALKLVRVLGLAPEQAERARGRLLREAQAMARLSEPNVVAVHDASVVGEDVYVAMELVAGVDLATWLAASERDWRQVIDVFIDAGAGLAAAHAAGVVHRDFKPSNVLIGPSDRVRVTDFGLAAIEGRLALGSEPEVAGSPPPASSDALTRTGTTMGTPAYMSPEARRRDPVDERSDQYSFAVSLAEALSGERPEAEHAPAVGAAPPRVRRILERALAAQPAARFASMDELTSALSRARRSPRRRAAVAAAALVAITAAGAAGFWGARRGETGPCGAGPTKLEGVWDREVRSRIEAAFTASEVGYAADVLVTATANLDRFAAAWVDGYTDACEATHVRHEQSAELLDRRMHCLGGELRRFAATTELLGRASPPIVARAISISGLGDGLARCADVAALTRETPRPVGPSAEAEIERIDEEYTRVRGLALEGKQREALAAIESLVRAAEAVGYDRMEAEIVGYLGELQWRTGDLEAARRSLYRAISAAERARSDDIRAGTMSVLVAVIGFEEGRHREALEIARLAELALEAAGDRARLANLISNRGSIHFARGDIDAAEADYRRARALMREEYGPDDPRTGQIINNVALIEEERGRHDDAVASYSEALGIYEKSLGKRHPQIALTLANRASSLANLERHDGATDDLERALAIRRETLGDAHPDVAMTYRVMAQVADAAGDRETALAHALRAAELGAAAYPARHPEIAATGAVLGKMLARLERHEEAARELRAALAIWAEREVENAFVSETRFNLAIALWGSGGDRREALALARRARKELADRPDSAAAVETWLRERR
jgi:tetratricopeptide (TPR) repeat protein